VLAGLGCGLGTQYILDCWLGVLGAAGHAGKSSGLLEAASCNIRLAKAPFKLKSPINTSLQNQILAPIHHMKARK